MIPSLTCVDLFQECKDTLGFNLAAMDHLKVSIFLNLRLLAIVLSIGRISYHCFFWILQQLMALKSDALFRDAKTKLHEIRSRYSQRAEARADVKEGRRKKKRQKKSDDVHVWS